MIERERGREGGLLGDTGLLDDEGQGGGGRAGLLSVSVNPAGSGSPSSPRRSGLLAAELASVCVCVFVCVPGRRLNIDVDQGRVCAGHDITEGYRHHVEMTTVECAVEGA